MSEAFNFDRLKSLFLLDHPFWATAFLHLNCIEDRNVPTAWTNGTDLRYNPDYFASLTFRQQKGLLAHETGHCVLLHMFRRGGRDMREWNEACDFAINPTLLEDDGLELPGDFYDDPQFHGMSAEQIYSKRRQMEPPAPPQDEPEQEEEEPEPDQEPGEQDEQGDSGDDEGDSGDEGDEGQGDDEQGEQGDEGPGEQGEGEGEGEGEGPGEPVMAGCPTGEFTDGAETGEAGQELTAADWEVIASEAQLVAQSAGMLPGGMGRLLKESREAQVDWKAETRDFWVNTIPTQSSWTHPNRRLLPLGHYFPGAYNENVGTIAMGLDLSGSVTQELLDVFCSETTGLMREVRPERLIVIGCDAEVHWVKEFTPDDAEVKMTLGEVGGGGGTKFQPVFDYLEEHQIDPEALIYLTDLEGPAPVEPAYPVLWVTPMFSQQEAPFGRLVRIP